MDGETIERDLHNYFSDSNIFSIINIISQGRQLEIDRPKDYLQKKIELQDELFTVMQSEAMSSKNHLRCFFQHFALGWTHIVVIFDKAFLINIYGCRIVCSDCLFSEGELVIRNLREIEGEHIILFDLDYIVRGGRQHVICYYDFDDFMVWKGHIKEIPQVKRTDFEETDNRTLEW